MARSSPSLLIVALMLTSSMLGLVSLTPEPASALSREITSTEDLGGSGTNRATLDKVVIDDGSLMLDTDVFEISDTQWSDANAEGVVVDNQNRPVLALASHWTQNPGYNSNGAFGHSAALNRDSTRVLIYGGAHDSGGSRFIHNDIWSYNPTSGDFNEMTAAPRAKAWHTAVWADSYHMMIVWGGATIGGSTLYLLNETMVYWPANNSWGFRAPCPFGGRIYHTASWDSQNDQMLVFGGSIDGGLENVTGELWAYKAATNSWERLPSMPATFERGGAASAWDAQNNKLIVYGGRRGNNNPMTSVFTYSPASRSWTQKSNSPVARYFHSMSWDTVGNRAYAFGGISGSGLSARLYRYNPTGDSWVTDLDAAPDARFWCPFIWDSANTLGLAFAGAASGNPPLTSFNDVMVWRNEVPFVTQGWLTSATYDLGGILSVGELSWLPATQPGSCGPDAVRFQVATSGPLDNPTNFVGPDGTSSTYFTDPKGTLVGDYHFGSGRLAYRVYFHTDDETISPTLTSVNLKVIRYAVSGTYTSPVYDLHQNDSSFERMRYQSTIPPDSNLNLVKVTVRVRASQQADMSGATDWEEITKDDTSIDIPYGRYFQFEVTLKTDSQKRHLTPTFGGLTVEYNSPPILSGWDLDRYDGDRTTMFMYKIRYTDVDNDEPATRRIYIDGVPHDMSSPDLEFTDGAVFSYSTRLPLGEHTFWFEFSDGKNIVRDPATGVHAGPEVLNRDPVAIINYPASGSRFVPSEPVEFSGASSKDDDQDPITFRWVSSIQGELSTSESFVKKLIEGVHVISLEVTDSEGSSSTTQISLEVKPYLPYIEIKDIYFDDPKPVEMDRVTVNAVVYNYGEATARPAVVEFLVDNEVMHSVEQTLEVDGRLVAQYQWTATGDKAFLSVRTRPGRDADIDDEVIRTINVTANSPPVISYDVHPLSVYEGEPVSFINNGTADPNDDKMAFSWDFGDGSTSTDASTQHLFAYSGSYIVSLKVTDARGGETVRQWTILVEEEPADEGSAFSMPVIGGIAVAVIVLLLLVVFLMRRGRRGEPQAPEGGHPEEWPRTERPLPPPPRDRPLPPPHPPEGTVSPYGEQEAVTEMPAYGEEPPAG